LENLESSFLLLKFAFEAANKFEFSLDVVNLGYSLTFNDECFSAKRAQNFIDWLVGNTSSID